MPDDGSRPDDRLIEEVCRSLFALAEQISRCRDESRIQRLRYILDIAQVECGDLLDSNPSQP